MATSNQLDKEPNDLQSKKNTSDDAIKRFEHEYNQQADEADRLLRQKQAAERKRLRDKEFLAP